MRGPDEWRQVTSVARGCTRVAKRERAQPAQESEHAGALWRNPAVGGAHPLGPDLPLPGRAAHAVATWAPAHMRMLRLLTSSTLPCEPRPLGVAVLCCAEPFWLALARLGGGGLEPLVPCTLLQAAFAWWLVRSCTVCS